MYFASAFAATQRGYHCLFFDAPGQGTPLIEHGIHLRVDWETVVRAVVDVAVTLPLIDTKRIALSGWSLGGYLSLRAATDEPRLAACIADPGLWGPLAVLGADKLQPGVAAG
jgi:alpha-beta hydrolase superfamily lysophospholipase